MFVIGNLIHACADILRFVLELYFWILLVRVVLSWANADPMNGLVRFVEAATEPVLRPLRRLCPPFKTGGWDLSPLLAAVVIMFLQRFLVPTLHAWANHLG